MEERAVLIGKPGDESPALAVLPSVYETLPVGPNGETYRALGYVLVAYADTREPYVPPKKAPKES